MIGFLIRKTFYDLWDNMFKIVALNVGFLACVMLPIFLPMLAAKFVNSLALDLTLLAFGIMVCSVYLSAVSYSVRSISDYSNFTFKEFFMNFKHSWLAGLVMGGFVFLVFLIVTVVIPFYFTMEPPAVGLLLTVIIIWTTFFALLSFQYYFSVYIRLGKSIKKSIKKCILISLDNTGLSIFVFLHNIIGLVISAILAFMFPGPVGMLLYIDEALRLRLLKYDWLEANPDENRKKIPWDVLLIEEREKTGTRSFRNLIFPWKD